MCQNKACWLSSFEIASDFLQISDQEFWNSPSFDRWAQPINSTDYANVSMKPSKSLHSQESVCLEEREERHNPSTLTHKTLELT